MSILCLIIVTSKRSGMLGQRECVALGISMILCSTTDLVLTSVCLPFGASGWELGRCCNKCRWQDLVPNRGVPMGNVERPTWAAPMTLTYWCIFWHFGTRCLPGYHGPFVSPLSPLLALCLLFCLLLLLPAAAAWLGFLFCSTAQSSWVLLFWKECESVWLPKSMSGDLGGQSPKIWFRTSFAPRSDLV